MSNTNKRIIEVEDAPRKLLVGADKIANLVKVTLGPSGRNVVIGVRGGNPVITNDGVSIAKEVFLEDEIEDLGARVLREVSMRTNDKVGDGTTTAMVLAQAVLHTCMDKMGSKDDVIKIPGQTIALKRQIDIECAEVVAQLQKSAKQIKTKADLWKVAYVSSESEELAELIADTMFKIGKDGIITVEDGQTPDTEIVHTQGMRVESGFVSPYMVTNDKLQADLTKPYYLVTDQQITNVEVLVQLAKLVSTAGAKEMVIIAQVVNDSILQIVVQNRLKGIFNFVCVNAPYFQQANVCKDIAALTNATFFDSKGMDINKNPELITLESLGTSERFIGEFNESTIVGGNGDVEDRIAKLKVELEKETSAESKKRVEQRMAALKGGIAVLKIGAVSDTERRYLRDKAEDTVNAVRVAFRDGVVPGGGLALKQIADKLPTSWILKEPLLAPHKQIQENAGGELEIGPDIVDPLTVTVTALQNACSVAGTLITAGGAINTKQPKELDALLNRNGNEA